MMCSPRPYAITPGSGVRPRPCPLVQESAVLKGDTLGGHMAATSERFKASRGVVLLLRGVIRDWDKAEPPQRRPAPARSCEAGARPKSRSVR